ncbi:hypothetical protein P9112_012992 [Eukaryota sp. TZLM1-RC]
MSTIDFWLREIDGDLTSIEESLSQTSVTKMENQQLCELVDSVEAKLRQTNLDIRQTRTLLVDVDWNREEYEQKLDEAASRRNKLVEFHADVKRKCNRNNLIADTENLTDGQKVRAAQVVAEKTSGLIKHGRNMLHNIEGQAVVTADELASQTGVLENVHQHQQELRSELKIAEHQLRVFLRTMMTDKFIMMVLLLIVLGLLFIIVYSIINPDANTNVPDEFKPSS